MLRKLKLYLMWKCKKNQSSLQHYYKTITVKFPSGITEQGKSVEWWYEMALRHLGYGDGWSPEGLPKRIKYGNGKYMQSHEDFYYYVIAVLKLRSLPRAEPEGIYEPGLS